jgi:GAF domain-containing protein
MVTAEHTETALAPIKVRDAVVGVIDAHKPRGAGPWTQDELGVLDALTDQLGVALDSARLYQETQRRVVQEQLTAEVTARMRQTLDVDSVLRTAVQEMGAALGLGKVEVRLGQPGGHDWRSQSGGKSPSESGRAGDASTEGIKGDGDGVTH